MKIHKSNHWYRSITILIVGIGLVIGTSSIPTALAATYDSSFGIGGVTETYLSGYNLHPVDSVVYADNSVAVAGMATNTENKQGWFALRYSSTGVLDTSFGTSGISFIPSTTSPVLKRVQITPTGELLLAGSERSADGMSSLGVVAKLGTDGKLVQQFGINGFVSVAGVELHDMLSLTTDGFITVADTTYGRWTIAKYNFDGQLSTGFGNQTGIVYPRPELTNSDQLLKLAEQPDHSFVAVGLRHTAGTNYHDDRLISMRFLENGGVDSKYGNGGVAIDDAVYKSCQIYDAYIYAKQTVVAATCQDIANSTYMPVLQRFTPFGANDTTFTPKLSPYDTAGSPDTFGVTLDGKLYYGTRGQKIYRLQDSGAFDSQFGDNGSIDTSLTSPPIEYSFGANTVTALAAPFGMSSEGTMRFGVMLARMSLNDSNPSGGNNGLSDHDTGFRPSYDGFGFTNPAENPKTAELTGDQFLQFFGRDKVAYPNGEWSHAAADFYHSDYQRVASTGNCFGMSGASVINFMHLNQPQSGSYALPWMPGYVSATKFDSIVPNSSQTYRSILGYYSGTQKSERNNESVFAGSTEYELVKRVLADIKQKIDANTPAIVDIKGFNVDKVSGHVLVAYKYEETADGTLVYVYDVNHQRDDTRTIYFTNDGQWSYHLGEPNKPSLDWGTGKKDAQLSVVPVGLYLEQGILPDDVIGRTTLVLPSYIGHQIYQDSTNSSSESPLRLYPTIGYSDIEPSTVTGDFPSDKPFTFHYQNDTGVKDSFSAYTAGRFIRVDGLADNIGEVADVSLTPDLTGIAISSEKTIENYSVTVSNQTANNSLAYVVSGTKLDARSPLTISMNADNSLVLHNESNTSQTVSVMMSEKAVTNGSQTIQTITVSPGATVAAKPLDWNKVTSTAVELKTDPTSDGTYDTTTLSKYLDINDGAKTTTSNKLLVAFYAPTGTKEMRVSNKAFSSSDRQPRWESFSSKSTENVSGSKGTKTIYVQYRLADGSTTPVYSASIELTR